jgi:predicted ABC-type ATPase
VRRGGHDIPDDLIRRRYHSGQLNLIGLLPKLTELWVYDNSEESDPASGQVPKPKLILHWKGEILGPPDLSSTPNWAKPIVAAAMKLA